MMVAICTGCAKKSTEVEEYSDENPVESDGTYNDGKFVCTSCYVFLVDMGMDIGTPEQLQKFARDLVRPITQ